VRQVVERRELLGQDDRVAHRDDDDARPEADRRRPPGEVGEGRDGLEDRPVVLGRARVDEEVIGRPDVGEAEPLGDLAGGVDALARRVVAEGGKDEPVVHVRDRTTPAETRPAARFTKDAPASPAAGQAITFT
jgi:hypothetical protein